jgi:chitodextrinase
MDIPLPFGLVRGRLYAGVGDSTDLGRAPDLVGLTGTATFFGTVVKQIVTDPGDEMIIVPQSIVAQVADGVLMWQEEADVPLTANLAADGTSLGWQWKVSFNLTQPTGQAVVLPGWTLDVKVYVEGDDDTVTNLVESAPVSQPSPLVIITKGDKGDPGDPGPRGPAGTVDPNVVRSVIVVTGAEARPTDADVVLWIDPNNLGAANSISTDVVFNLLPEPPDVTAPTVPADLVASDIGLGEFTISWTASTDDKAVTGYRYRLNGGAPVLIGPETSKIISGLSPSTAYTVDLAAGDAAGNWSAYTAAINVTTDAITVPQEYAAWDFSAVAYPIPAKSGTTAPALAAGASNTIPFAKTTDRHGGTKALVASASGGICEIRSLLAVSPNLAATGFTLMFAFKRDAGIDSSPWLQPPVTIAVASTIIKWNPTNQVATALSGSATGQWVHYTAQWDPVTTNLTIYIDGVKTNQQAIAPSGMGSLSPTQFQFRLSTSNTLQKICDIRFWNQVLDPSIIDFTWQDAV